MLSVTENPVGNELQLIGAEMWKESNTNFPNF